MWFGVGRGLKMRLCSKLCEEIFDICLPVKLLSSISLEALSTLLFTLVVRVIMKATAIFRAMSPIASRRMPGHIREFNRLEPHSSHDLVFKIWRNNKTEATFEVFCL